MNSETNNKKIRRTKTRKRRSISQYWWLWGSGCIVIAFLILALVQVYLSYRRSSFRMEKLSHEVVDLRSAMNIDSVRQYKIQKIMKIILFHNSSLSSDEVYSIASEIYEMSIKYTNLDVDLLCAVITHESAGKWDPKIVSKAGALGLMQIMPVTGFFLSEYENISWTSPEEIFFNPIYNIRLGSRFLSMLIERYGFDGGLAAYNGGEKQAAIWLKNRKDDKYLCTETRGYIPAVHKLYDKYQAKGL